MNEKSKGRAQATGRRLYISFNQLTHVIAAADHGSFRQAAQALSIKQSTVSHSVQIVEHAFGIIIFERSRAGVQATLPGRHFLRTARSVLEQLNALATVTKATGRGEVGQLIVGFCTSLSMGNLRTALIDFKARFPQVELGTIERSRLRLVTALRNGAIDVQISTGEVAFQGFNAAPLWSERIFVVMPDNHLLAKQEVAYWTDLRNYTVLLSRYGPGVEIESLLNAKLLMGSDRPRIERHDVSRGAIESLISMGAGISLVLESDAVVSLSGLAYRELRDGTGPSRVGFSVVWRGDNENPALINFLKLLAERYPFLLKE